MKPKNYSSLSEYGKQDWHTIEKMSDAELIEAVTKLLCYHSLDDHLGDSTERIDTALAMLSNGRVGYYFGAGVSSKETLEEAITFWEQGDQDQGVVA